ncbi:hypothetical protein L596_008135 [Steinernema carpocapsae]|uniref:Uncharacterized protein n=1 Tax=Steinernema carpocapsae TaxID=34508 RepID=A0A4U5PC17_STECR|nr:hypothetical protein L596_008135 [Steinernema carpocapsae]
MYFVKCWALPNLYFLQFRTQLYRTCKHPASGGDGPVEEVRLIGGDLDVGHDDHVVGGTVGVVVPEIAFLSAPILTDPVWGRFRRSSPLFSLVFYSNDPPSPWRCPEAPVPNKVDPRRQALITADRGTCPNMNYASEK